MGKDFAKKIAAGAVWLLIWLAPRLGIALPAENTYLLHFFMTVGPMGLLSSLS